MKHGISLPFKAGHKVELRTFEEGFRGAWFRCEIKTIREENGRLGHVSTYDDFPEEKVVWTSLFEENPHCKGNIKELMLRPSYPPIYNENQMPHASEISEVTVIGRDSWRVGDLVDWWNSDCYWSGKITEFCGDDECQIDLFPKPIGEGLSYNVLLTDLRPSLDWSLELGWTVPTPEDGSGRPCARIVKPINQVVQRAISIEHSHHAAQDTEVGSSAQSNNSADSNAKKSKIATKTKTSSLEKTVSKRRKEKDERGLVNSNTRKTSLPSSDSVQNEAGPAADHQLNSSRNKRTFSRSSAQSFISADSNAKKIKTATKTNISSSLGKTVSKKRKENKERGLVINSDKRKRTSLLSSVSAQKDAEPAAEIAEEEPNHDSSQNKHTGSGGFVLHSKCSDLPEAAIFSLVEYLNKVKWLKKMMKCGFSSSDAKPKWALEIPK